MLKLSDSSTFKYCYHGSPLAITTISVSSQKQKQISQNSFGICRMLKLLESPEVPPDATPFFQDTSYF